MVIGLGALAFALVVQGASGGLVLFTIGLIGVTVAKNLFDVGSAGWVGAAVPYESRGRAMGYMETSWALAFIIGMPLAALLIRATTWRTPFLVTAAGCLIASLSLGGKLERPERSTADQPRLRWTTNIRAGLAAIVAIGVGHAMMLVTFASWLEDEHAISISGLGLTAIVIGFAELGGSGGAALLSDRFGLTRTIELAWQERPSPLYFCLWGVLPSALRWSSWPPTSSPSSSASWPCCRCSVSSIVMPAAPRSDTSSAGSRSGTPLEP